MAGKENTGHAFPNDLQSRQENCADGKAAREVEEDHV